ncbi:copper resistance protein B [Dyella psychrodurans]|nr:copper resistance protein B [Dyella psychrodurans]
MTASAQSTPMPQGMSTTMDGTTSMPTSPVQPASSTSSGDISMKSMEMNDNASHGMLLIDQLEYASGYHGNGPMWEAEAWYGNDSNKFWLRSEGEGSQGRIDSGDIEALWSRPVSSFWDAQLGIRHDLGIGAKRNWMAFGVEGLAPYWVDLQATAYAGESGRFAARMRAEYTLRFTQRWMLQPEFELNAYNRGDVTQQIGSGISTAQLGLRLRYEISRQWAPYLGLAWTRRFGGTAGFARADHVPVFDRQILVGIRIWL